MIPDGTNLDREDGWTARYIGRELLTDREAEAIRILATGVTRHEAAARMGITHKSIRTHLTNAFAKLDAQSLVQALNALGWITPTDRSGSYAPTVTSSAQLRPGK